MALAAAKLYQPLCVCHLFDLGFFYRSQGRIWLKLAERLSFFSAPPQLVLLLKRKILRASVGGLLREQYRGLETRQASYSEHGLLGSSFDYPSQAYAFY